jgi:ABC-type multidrug transport system permease subunit
MTTLAMFITAAGVVAVLLFFLLILPVWLFVHCMIAEHRGAFAKVIWALLMLCSFPLGPYVFGLLASRHWGFRFVSFVMVSAFAALITAGVLLMPYMQETSQGAIEYLTDHIAEIDTDDLTPIDQTQVTAALDILKAEMGGGWSQLKDQLVNMELIEMLQVYTGDAKLSAAEMKDWLGKVDARKLLDRQELQSYIETLKQGIGASTDVPKELLSNGP